MISLALTQEREHVQLSFVVVGHLDESWNKATDDNFGLTTTPTELEGLPRFDGSCDHLAV